MRAVCFDLTSLLVKIISKSMSLTALPAARASIIPFSVRGISTSLRKTFFQSIKLANTIPLSPLDYRDYEGRFM